MNRTWAADFAKNHDWHQQRANQTNAGWLLGYVFVVIVIAVAFVGWWMGL